MSKGERTYGQYCPIAAGLDVIGDRWVLLICRELSMGDCRFTDLRARLDGIAPNLLSSRLRALQEAGLVTTAELPPPAARTVYRLTEHGRSVVPVLRAMARFGVQFLDGEPTEGFDARRAALSLLLPWWRPGSATPLRAKVDLGPAGTVDVVTGASVAVAEPTPGADLTVLTDVAALVAARRQGSALQATFKGKAVARNAFLEAFSLTAA